MLISKEATSRAPWERRLFADRARADPHRLLPPVREKLVISETPFISMWSDIGAELKLSEEVAAAPRTDSSHSSSTAAETPLETRLSKLPAATI